MILQDTTRPVSEWSAQEIFDYVVDHLRSMKRQSRLPREEGGGCAYRAERGNACAIGCLIPGSVIRGFSTFAGTIYDIIAESPKIELWFGNKNIDLLARLQYIHDDEDLWTENGFTGENWLINSAQRYDLVYTPPT